MRVLTGMQKADVCAAYSDGVSSVALGMRYGVSSAAIRGLLARRGVETRGRSAAARRHTCDHSFFNSIDSEDKAYWLGFLAADGYVGRTREVVVVLKEGDRDHLDAFKGHLRVSHPIITAASPSVKARSQRACRITITSPEIACAIAAHGIVGCKSFTMPWPTLHADLVRHYARGYIDGDGGFCRTATGRFQFYAVGNGPFLAGMQAWLMQACGLNKTRLDQRHKDSPIYTLRYSGERQLACIAMELYSDAHIYLPRKKLVIDALLNR